MGKIEIPPASFWHSEVKMPLEPEKYQIGCLNFYRGKNTNQEGWVSYPRAQLVLIPSWVLVPLHHDAKLKWNHWKEMCKLKKSNTMRCVKPRQCQSDRCPWEGGQCLRPFTDPRTSMFQSKELSISLTLTPGERHGLWKTHKLSNVTNEGNSS